MALELNDSILIDAPRDQVYAALNDPEILKQAIPGCEELTQISDTELEAKVVLKIGPVKARFNGKVTLDKSDAPGGFSLRGEGSGGVAGFAKGGDVARKYLGSDEDQDRDEQKCCTSDHQTAGDDLRNFHRSALPPVQVERYD